MKGESLGQVEKLKERQIGKKKNSQTDVITDEQTNGQKKIDAYGVDYVIFGLKRREEEKEPSLQNQDTSN